MTKEPRQEPTALETQPGQPGPGTRSWDQERRITKLREALQRYYRERAELLQQRKKLEGVVLDHVYECLGLMATGSFQTIQHRLEEYDFFTGIIERELKRLEEA